MATVTSTKTGARIVRFFDMTGQRRTIRLGKVSLTAARDFGEFIERLREAKKLDERLSKATVERLRNLPDKIHVKLADTGLVAPRSASSLERFLCEYVDGRTDVNPETRLNWGHTTRNLVDFFGPDRDLRSITEADAEEWSRWLDTCEKLALETRKKRHGNAKQFFRWAIKKRLLEANPFEHLDSNPRANKDRHRFISGEEATKLIEACPDASWRLLVALSRYGGLRIPSEALRLQWSDINWGEGWMWVRGKRHRHQQKRDEHPKRKLPLFPELRPHLETAYEMAAEGERYALEQLRKGRRGELTARDVNLDKPFKAIIERAGLHPWPRLWHNMRASRQTELVSNGVPEYVVNAWIGNTQQVAREHYLQVTDEHIAAAASGALQKALHKIHETSPNDASEPEQESEKPRKNRGFRQMKPNTAQAEWATLDSNQ